MTTERRKEISDEDLEGLAPTMYKVHKSKRRKTKGKLGFTFSLLAAIFPWSRPALATYSYNLTNNTAQTLRKTFFKLGFYIWCFAVVLSILSLTGINVMQPFSLLSFSEAPETSRGRALQTSTGEEDSFINWLPSSFNFGSFSESAKEEEEVDPELEDDLDDDIPEQVLPMSPKVGNKLNKRVEKELACTEEECNATCNEKIKPKCARSSSCRKEREKLCKRRCRKQRCEERCKDEPKFGYVEREQRMDKCKEECTGPTAVHNKCIKKCHSQFKPCKSRCHEIAGKYTCDKPSALASLKQAAFPAEEMVDMDDEII